MKLQSVVPKNVTTIANSATVQDAAKLMRLRGVGMLPVTDPNGIPIGVVTDRDLVMRSLADAGSPGAPVTEAMTPKVIAIRQDQDLQTALDLMKEKSIGRILVCDDSGKLTGVVSLSDAAVLCHGDSRIAEVSDALTARGKPR